MDRQSNQIGIKIGLLWAVFIAGIFQSSIAADGVLREYWTGISGTQLTALRQNANYPNNPSGKAIESSFQAPIDWADNYATKMSAYITAPMTGQYVFWISCDDDGELWLSTDDNPANKFMIARVSGWTGSLEWTKYSTQQSSLIYLEAGKKYYIEAFQKEEGGGDNLAVGWQLPNGMLERPIPGSRLRVPEDYTQWSNKKNIYLNTTSSGADVSQDVHNFPVLIRLDATNFNFSQAMANGEDIRFATDYGAPLSYQIERWDPATGLAEIWVRVNKVFGDDDTQYFTMYWGQSNVFGESDGSKVFSSENSFVAAYHFSSDDPLKDATGSGNNGQDSGSTIGEGSVGKGRYMNGTAYIVVPDTVMLEPEAFTISAWIKRDGTQQPWAKCVSKGYNGGPFASYTLEMRSTTDQVGFQTAKTNNNYSFAESGNEVADNTWYYLTGTYDPESGNGRFYLNGVLKNEFTDYYPIEYYKTTPYNLNIGAQNGSCNFKGSIDEVVLSNQVRNPEWIKLSYENQKTDQQFVSVGNAPQIPAPTNFYAASSSGYNYGIALSWQSTAANVDGFEISYGSSSSNMQFLATVGPNTRNYMHRITTCGASFYYSIKAYHKDHKSAATVTTTPATTLPCIPVVPVGLIAQAESESEIAVTWQGSAPRYILQAAVLGMGGSWYQVYDGPATSFSHQGLMCSMPYSYRVQAVNSAGASGWTHMISAATKVCPIPQPTSLTADNSAPLKISLSWVNNATRMCSYKVLRKADGESDFTTISWFLPAFSTSYVDSQVTCNTQYSYYVVAWDFTAESVPSNIVDVATLYCGANKNTSEMITLSGMFLENQVPFTGDKPLVTVNLYKIAADTTLLYYEAFSNVPIKNGYFSVTPGLSQDIVSIIQAQSSLYYDILIDGNSAYDNRYQPLTASPYSIKNSFNLYGNGTPVGLVSAPVGASYVDVQNKVLYMKNGQTKDDWMQVGN